MAITQYTGDITNSIPLKISKGQFEVESILLLFCKKGCHLDKGNRACVSEKNYITGVEGLH